MTRNIFLGFTASFFATDYGGPQIKHLEVQDVA